MKSSLQKTLRQFLTKTVTLTFLTTFSLMSTAKPYLYGEITEDKVQRQIVEEVRLRPQNLLGRNVSLNSNTYKIITVAGHAKSGVSEEFFIPSVTSDYPDLAKVSRDYYRVDCIMERENEVIWVTIVMPDSAFLIPELMIAGRWNSNTHEIIKTALKEHAETQATIYTLS